MAQQTDISKMETTQTAVDFLLEKMSNLGVIYAEGIVLKELNDSIKKAIAI